MKRPAKKNNKAWALVLLFLIGLILLDQLAGAGLKRLKPDTALAEQSWMWQDFYAEPKDSVELMFLGSSHARFAFDPAIFDAELGITSFNLSSALQTPLVGYYALRQALQTQHPDVLVMDAYWYVFGMADNTEPAYYVYDNLRDRSLRWRMMAQLLADEDFSEFFFQKLSPSYRYRDNAEILYEKLKTGLHLGQTIEPPQVDTGYRYGDKGYFYSEQVIEQKYLQKDPYEGWSFDWDQSQLDYFAKIIELCRENDIRVLLVTTPSPQQIIDYLPDYDAYSERFGSLADAYGIEYIDFNRINREQQLFPTDYFMDTSHLNYRGAVTLDAYLLPTLRLMLAEGAAADHE